MKECGDNFVTCNYLIALKCWCCSQTWDQFSSMEAPPSWVHRTNVNTAGWEHSGSKPLASNRVFVCVRERERDRIALEKYFTTKQPIKASVIQMEIQRGCRVIFVILHMNSRMSNAPQSTVRSAPRTQCKMKHVVKWRLYRSGLPNPRSVGQYQSIGHLVADRSGTQWKKMYLIFTNY